MTGRSDHASAAPGDRAEPAPDGNLLSRVLDTVSSLLRNEVDLARAEISQGLRAAAFGVALLVLSVIAALAGVTVLGACNEREVILPGERLGVREVLQGGSTDAAPPENRAADPALPGPVVNAAWLVCAFNPGLATTFLRRRA